MADKETLLSLLIKVLKLVFNLAVIIMYRVGDGGYFLGIGGTWNLNEEKTADSEIIASGVFVGFFIYTAVVLVAFLFGPTDYFKRGVSDTIMNFIGAFMWISVGGTALHYWNSYVSEREYPEWTSERGVGLGMGVMCVFTSILYFVDTVVALLHSTR
ncbi:protein snakeskin-like [Condylostylus longicornis]|uniref:protein snakeskin-like n=1 Tax=Condylostylus longicornis TaxID=2530218 RepID=UPI00244DB50D|nr:protein snakeskin-like [Condylostylus longicornis]